MAGRGYLPPVVAAVIGDISDFTQKLEVAKRLGEEFDGEKFTAEADLDTDKMRNRAVEIRAMVAAEFAKPITQEVEVKVNKADLAALLGGLAMGRFPAGGLSIGGLGRGLADAATAAEAENKAARAAEMKALSGLFGKAFWGGGHRHRGGGIGGIGGMFNPFRWGLAGIGSIGAFAGLGAEHVLMTGLGVAGSAASALGGAGLLGLGALAPMAVGGLSDAAVMRATSATAKDYADKLDRLNRAIAVYGAGSIQAQAAQYDLNQTIAGLSPAAKAAEIALANAGETLDQTWNTSIDNARVQAAAILTQVKDLATRFAPLVGQAAQRNLAITNNSLKPLFAWLEGPQGIGIFTDLENHFATNLPFAVDALDQSIEFLLKTLDYLSGKTGNVMQRFDDFMQHMNTAQGFSTWEGHMDHMIQSFHVWSAFLHILGKDIVDLFKPDVGTGQSIIQTITEMLQHLNTWENSTQGKSELHTIFEVHKQEVLDLLRLLPPLVSAFSNIYMAVAPAMTRSLTLVLEGIAPVLDALAKNPFGAWLLGITLLAGKLGILGMILSPVVTGLKAIATMTLDKLGIALGSTGKQTALEANTLALNRLTDVMAGEGIVGGGGKPGLGNVAGDVGETGAAAGILEKVGGSAGVASIVGAVIAVLGGMAGGDWLGKLIGGGVGGKQGAGLGGHLGTIAGGAAGGAVGGAALGTFVFPGVGTAVGALAGGLAGAEIGLITTFWGKISGGVKTLGGQIGDVLTGKISLKQFGFDIGHDIGRLFDKVGSIFKGVDLGKGGAAIGNALGSFFNGITGTFNDLTNGRLPGWLTGLHGNVGKFLGNLSDDFMKLAFVDVPNRIGQVVQGVHDLLSGIKKGLESTASGRWIVQNIVNPLQGAIAGVIHAVAGSFTGGNLGQILLNAGEQALHGAVHGTTGGGTKKMPGMMAAGGFVPTGQSFMFNEGGPEFGQVSSAGVTIYSASSQASQNALGARSATITISAPITVTAPSTMGDPHQLATLVATMVRKEFTQVVRGLSAGAYSSRSA